MNWTIGIITTCGQQDRVRQQILSIKAAAQFAGLAIDEYEIIIVGGEPPILTKDSQLLMENVRIISFNEGQRPAWITRKKNIIAQDAVFDNICIMHDYMVFDKNWFKGWEEFGDKWDVGINPVLNQDNSRFRDWMLWLGNYENGQIHFLDYAVADRTNEMYISGSYFCVKRDFIRSYPLDEHRSWGEGEDVEWSLRLRDRWNYKFNPYSKVHFIKWKECYPTSPGPIE